MGVFNHLSGVANAYAVVNHSDTNVSLYHSDTYFSLYQYSIVIQAILVLRAQCVPKVQRALQDLDLLEDLGNNHLAS